MKEKTPKAASTPAMLAAACFPTKEAFEKYREGLRTLYLDAYNAECRTMISAQTKEEIVASTMRMQGIVIARLELNQANWPETKTATSHTLEFKRETISTPAITRNPE